MENPVPNSNQFSVRSMVVASKDQVSSELASDMVILDLKGGTYHGLNSTGARIWSLLAVPRTIGEIRDTILREYDVEPQRCERDLLSLMDQLAAKGLVEVCARAA
jgi:hypothetical protein